MFIPNVTFVVLLMRVLLLPPQVLCMWDEKKKESAPVGPPIVIIKNEVPVQMGRPVEQPMGQIA